MKNTIQLSLCVLVLMSFLSTAAAQTICDAPSQLLCGNTLDGFSTLTPAPDPTIPPNGVDCGFENATVIQFWSCADSAAIELTVGGCSLNFGINYSVLEVDTSCQTVATLLPCTAVANNVADTLTMNNLTPGTIYSIVIEGDLDDVCSVSFAVLDGIDTSMDTLNFVSAGMINGPTTICTGSASYDAVFPICELVSASNCPGPNLPLSQPEGYYCWSYPAVFTAVGDSCGASAIDLELDSIGLANNILSWADTLDFSMPDTLNFTIPYGEISIAFYDTSDYQGYNYQCNVVDNCNATIPNLAVSGGFQIIILGRQRVCPGETFSIFGQDWGAGIAIQRRGCEIQLLQIYEEEEDFFLGVFEICDGDLFDNGFYQTSVAGFHRYLASPPCTYEFFELIVSPNLFTDLGTVEVCAGECFDYNGVQFCTPGSQTAFVGLCEEVQLDLVELPPPPIGNLTIVQCGCFTLDGTPYCDSGVFPHLTTTAAGCDSTVILDLTIEQSVQLTINAVEVCASDFQSFTVVLTISGGSPPYSVDGIPIGSSIYTSPPLPSGDSYAFQVEDAGLCGNLSTINGSFSCGAICTNDAGRLELNNPTVCRTADITATPPTDAVVQPDAISEFLLTTDAAQPFTTVVARATSGTFAFDPTFMITNTDYELVYVISEDDGNGNVDPNSSCLDISNAVTVRWVDLPVFSVSAPDSLGCGTDEVTLFGSEINQGSGDWEWSFVGPTGALLQSGSASTFEASQIGTYQVSVTDLANTCQAAESIEVASFSDLPTFDFLEWVDNDCSDLPTGGLTGIRITTSYPGTYFINDEPVADPLREPLTAGTYDLSLIDSRGCAVDTTFTIEDALPPLVSLPDSLLVEADAPFVVRSISNQDALNYEWQFDGAVVSTSEILDDLRITNSGPLMVTVTNSDGCSSSATVFVTAQVNQDFFLPNAFSPNGDGINDRLEIYFGNPLTQLKSIHIFDRWGGVVHKAEPNGDWLGWDGDYNGAPAISGVYIVQAQIQYADGSTEQVATDLTLIY